MIDLDRMTIADLEAGVAAHVPHVDMPIAEQRRLDRVARRLNTELVDRNAVRYAMLWHRRDQLVRRRDPNRRNNDGPGHCHKHQVCTGHYAGTGRGAMCECPPRQLALWPTAA